MGFIGPVRAAFLAGAALWCLWLAWGVSGVHVKSVMRRAAALVPMAAAVGIAAFAWGSLFWS
jgi:hypothetical protein